MLTTDSQKDAALKLARETLAKDLARLEQTYREHVPDGPKRDEAI